MNLSTNSKFINLLWWIIIPLLSAKLIISLGVLFLDSKNVEIKTESSKKNTYMYSFPKFSTKKTTNTQPKVKSYQKLDNLTLNACYVEKGREFVIVKDGSKTIFIDLNETHKNAKLVSITRNSARFLRDGTYIDLVLEKTKSLSSNKNFNSHSNKNRKNQNNEHPQNDNQNLADESFIDIKRKSIKRYTTNPQQALRDIRFSELRDGRNFKGLKLNYVKKGSLFDNMNLKKGDIIKTVNEIKLKSMMDLLPFYKSLEETTTLNIGFERSGEMKEIVYEIN